MRDKIRPYLIIAALFAVSFAVLNTSPSITGHISSNSITMAVDKVFTEDTTYPVETPYLLKTITVNGLMVKEGNVVMTLEDNGGNVKALNIPSQDREFSTTYEIPEKMQATKYILRIQTSTPFYIKELILNY